MKIIFLLVIFINIFTLAEASILPAWKGDIDDWEKSTLSYFEEKKHYGITDDKNELISTRENFLADIFDKDRPRMWIILGYLHKFEISFILSDLKYKGLNREQRSIDPEYREKLSLIN